METLTTAFVLMIIVIAGMAGFVTGGLWTYAIMLDELRQQRKRKYDD